MFKIFRKIRFDLLKENKIVRYIFYAIGEIILVIIGILLALNINNKNELRKQGEEVSKILNQIRNELAVTIDELDETIEFYRVQDSLIYLVLNGNVTYEDYYKPENFGYRYIMTYYKNSYIHDGSYKNLKSNIDNIPNKYKPLLVNLDKVYINDKSVIEGNYKTIGELIGETITYLRQNKNWFSGYFFSGKNMDEAINYFSTDSIYLNNVSFMHTMIRNNFLLNAIYLRTDTIRSYLEITKALGLEEEFRNNPPSFLYTTDDYLHYIGTYSNENYKVEIRVDDNHLVYIYDEEPIHKILPYSPSMFYVETRPNFYSLQTNDKGDVSSLTIRMRNSVEVLDKVE